MNRLKKLTLLGMESDLFTAMHFYVIIIINSMMLYINKETSLDLIIIVQSVIVGGVLSILQLLFFNKKSIFKGLNSFWASTLWSTSSVAITIISGSVFNWFEGLPKWNVILFAGIQLMALVIYNFVLIFKSETDTNLLNEALHNKKGVMRKKDKLNS